jgi:hypothetical protein
MDKQPRSAQWKQLSVRVRSDELRAIQELADLNGRTVTAEVRLALRVWRLRRRPLAHLETPAGQAECRAEGLDLKEERVRFEASLARIEVTTACSGGSAQPARTRVRPPRPRWPSRVCDRRLA